MIASLGRGPFAHSVFAFGLFAAALLVLPPASAAPLPAGAMAPQGDTGSPGEASLSPKDKATIEKVAKYLNAIWTMTARFEQIAQNGAVATGSLWLQRPGRMRFQYDPPSPILLIADRFYVYYIDTKLAEVSQIGLQATPAWFLLREHIRFGQRVVVTRIERGAGSLRLSVAEKKNPSLGTLTMIFREHPLALRGWTILDQEGKKTTVWLSNFQFGMALDPKLFQYKNPYESPYDNSTNNSE